MVGMEGIAWERELRISENMLVVDRSHTRIRKAIRFRGYERTVSRLFLATSNLREQEAAYHLEVELARGTLNRLRNYLSDRDQFFELSAAYQTLLNQNTTVFS